MGKTFAEVNNTTIKILVDMMNAAVKGYNEEITRIQSYMIESQSSGKAASWTAKDLGNVIDNIKDQDRRIQDAWRIPGYYLMR